MQQQINYNQLTEKWAPLLDADGIDKIQDSHRRNVTAALLENQEQMLRENAEFLGEASPTNSAGTGGFSGGSAAGGPVAGFDPVLISLIRRAMPNLVAYDLAGVQPMSGPTGLIFAMRSRYTNQSGTEALFDEPDTAILWTVIVPRTSPTASLMPLLVSVLLLSLVLTLRSSTLLDLQPHLLMMLVRV